MRSLTIGTRGSQLALWQARHTAELLRDLDAGVQVTIQVIRTTGDRHLERLPSQFSGKGIFVKEIEDALLASRVDLAVHSVKDLPGSLPPGLAITAYPEREDPRDALVTREGCSLAELAQGATVGTASVRRRAQLSRLRSDLNYVAVRGNVDTRLRKMTEGEVDAMVLAMAGLRRLGLAATQRRPLKIDTCLPAPGQGAMGVETRADDREVNELVARLDHRPTRHQVEAERGFLQGVDAGCLAPVAALARQEKDGLLLRAMVSSFDGARVLEHEERGDPRRAGEMGASAAAALLQQGGGRLLEEARRAAEASGAS